MTWLLNIYNSIFIRAKSAVASEKSRPGLGTLTGVFVPSLLLLFGVIIFMRLGWIVGQVGLVQSLLIIGLGALVALFSTLSVASIATNIRVGKGGAYYILSRSLGIDAGVSVGLPLYIKQTLAISLCIVGFSECLHDLVPALSSTTIGVITTFLLGALALNSTKGALKVQIIILALIALALGSLFSGESLSPYEPAILEPVPTYGFWAVFAIFFPAMTGLESSISLSGDLKNPSRSLPLGTLLALFVTVVVYMAIVIFLADRVPLERLARDPLILQDLARVPSLIMLGIWGTTLSGALAGLVTAPRTLQAIADDKIIWRIFGKTSGKDNEPRLAIITTFFFALLGVYFGSINVIAPLLTMISLICYTVLNLACGFETLLENPSWRPRFRLHWSIPMVGAGASIATMLMIDPGISMISLALVGLMFVISRSRNLRASWDDLQHGIWLFLSRVAIYRLAHEKTSSRSWRPHFLVFTTKPDEHSNYLLNFSQAISQNKGFLTMASFVDEPLASEEEKRKLQKKIGKSLKKDNIHALVQINYADKVSQGIESMIETYGLGPLAPNTVVFGGVSKGDTAEFAKLVVAANKKHCNVVILRDSGFSQDQVASKKELHIWQDSHSEVNTELMLILAYMLQRNKLWKKGQIWLKGLAPNEWVKKEKLASFSQFAEKKRFYLDTEVFVSGEPRDEFPKILKEASKNAGIVFLGIRRIAPGESLQEYGDYLDSMTKITSELPYAALVLSSEKTPLQSILQ